MPEFASRLNETRLVTLKAVLDDKREFSAQRVMYMRYLVKISRGLDIKRMFHIEAFEDDFNQLFSNFNIVIQFLFYTKSCEIVREDLFLVLKSFERGFLFSLLYYDMNMAATVYDFIQTMVKIGSDETIAFLHGSFTSTLKNVFNIPRGITKRLIAIIVKKTVFIPLSDDERRIVSCTRSISVENILDKYAEIFEDFPLVELLPFSDK